MVMATSFFQCLLLFSLLALIHMIIISPSLAKLSSSKSKTLVLPISKDASTLQYITTIKQRTPPVPVKLTVDLGGEFLWVDCNQGEYVSSTYIPAYCNTTACSVAETFACTWYCNAPQGPGCNNRTCFLWPDNTVVGGSMAYGEIAQDIFWGPRPFSADGTYSVGPMLSIPSFIFTCSNDASLTYGLAKGVKGMAGLGRANIALHSQFASHFNLARKFAICLPSPMGSYGVVFFGDGPYVLSSGIDLSYSLTFTKLIVNPVTTASSSPNYEPSRPSTEYFIGVKSIRVNDKAVQLNASLLVIDRRGNGGTKISTVDPYTVLETTIYNAIVDAFVKALPTHVARVTPVAPFGACFNSTHIGSSRVGPAVPTIDFVLDSKNVYWRVHGANSMVRVSKEVLCLGFVDAAKSDRILGYMNPRTSIVIGGHQLEENLLQFDLERNRVGFSSSLLSQQTSCANFNFTSTADI